MTCGTHIEAIDAILGENLSYYAIKWMRQLELLHMPILVKARALLQIYIRPIIVCIV